MPFLVSQGPVGAALVLRIHDMLYINPPGVWVHPFPEPWREEGQDIAILSFVSSVSLAVCSVCMSVCLYVPMFVCLAACASVCLSGCPSMCLSAHVFVFFADIIPTTVNPILSANPNY